MASAVSELSFTNIVAPPHVTKIWKTGFSGNRILFFLTGTRNRRGVGTGQNHAIRQAVFARDMKWHFRPLNEFVKKKIHKIMDILLAPPQNIVVVQNQAFKRFSRPGNTQGLGLAVKE